MLREYVVYAKFCPQNMTQKQLNGHIYIYLHQVVSTDVHINMDKLIKFENINKF